MISEKFKVGKFKFHTAWVFPKEVSFVITYLLRNYEIHWKDAIHIFAGKSNIGGVLLDINPQRDDIIKMDYKEMPKHYKNAKCVIADPPWQVGYGERRKISYAIRDTLKVGGIAIINAPWDPYVKGFDDGWPMKVRQCYNSYRDLTDLWVFKRIE